MKELVDKINKNLYSMLIAISMVVLLVVMLGIINNQNKQNQKLLNMIEDNAKKIRYLESDISNNSSDIDDIKDRLNM